jgi:hypothetical protein
MYRMCIAGVAAALLLAGSARWANAQGQDKECLDLIRKAIEAHGGQKVLENIKAATSKSKGTIHLGGGLMFTAEESVQLPDKFRSDIQIDANGMNIKITQAFDGKKGWVKVADNTMDLDDKQTAELKALMYAGKVGGLIELLKDKSFELSPLGEVKVKDRPAVGVLVKQKGQRDISLYFDKQNGLLAKTVMRVIDQMSQAEATQEKIFSDYKAVDGRQTPHKVAVLQDGNPYVDVEVTEVRIVDRHDPSMFMKPQ